MAITLVDAGLISQTGGTGNVTLSTSAAIEGDLVVLLGALNASTGSPGPVTAGYTSLIVSDPGGLGTIALSAHAKFMGSSPDTDVVGAGTGSGIAGCVYARYILRGVDADLLDDPTPASVGVSNAFANPGSVSIISDDALVMVVNGHIDQGNGILASAAPSGYSSLLTLTAVNLIDCTLSTAIKNGVDIGTEDPGNFTWAEAAGSQSDRVFTIAFRAHGTARRPDKPTLELVPGTGWTRFNTSPFQAHDDDPTDTHQTTKYQLSTSSTFSTFVVNVTVGDPNKITYLVEGLPAGTYYGRVQHVGEVFHSDWSDTASVVVVGNTSGTTPGLTLVSKGHDFIEVEIDPYDHPDGEVEPSAFDIDDPHPYLLQSEIQRRPGAAADWSSPTEIIDIPYVETVASRRYRFTGLTGNTQYKFRGRQLDGHLLVYTFYSADLTVTTDVTPAFAPLQPTQDITACGRALTHQGGTYSHSGGVGPGTAHANTEFRICYSGVCRSVVVASAATTYTWNDAAPGSASVYIRYGDDNVPTRWGPFSAADVCVVPPYPPIAKFISPLSYIVEGDETIEWIFNEITISWLSDVEISVDGGAWEVVATGQAGQTTPFDADAFADGDILYRVRAVNPTTGEQGSWATLSLILDRNPSNDKFHKGPGDLVVDEGRQIWDGPEHVSWSALYQDDEPLGLFASRVHSGSTTRDSGWVYDDWGTPLEFDLFVTCHHIFQENTWYPWRFSNARYTQGGAMILGIDGAMGARSGSSTLIDIGAQAWYLSHAAVDNSGIVNQTGSATTYANQIQPDRRHTYLLSGSLSVLRTKNALVVRSTYQHQSVTLPSSTGLSNGFFGERNLDSSTGESEIHTDHPMTMQIRARRGDQDGNSGWHIQKRAFGNVPGGIGWNSETFIRDVDDSDDAMPLGGAVGFAFSDIDTQGVGRSLGFLFTSISLRVIGCSGRLYYMLPDESWVRLTRMRTLAPLAGGTYDTLIPEGTSPGDPVASIPIIYYKKDDGEWTPITC